MLNPDRRLPLTLVAFVCITWLSGCLPMQSTQPNMRTLPNSYANEAADPTTSPNLLWRDYLKDSSLVALIDSALHHNLALAKGQQQVLMAQAALGQAQGLLLPFVSGTASMGQRRFGKYTMDGVGNFDTNFSTNITPEQRIPEHLPDYYLGLQASWEIDVWHKLRSHKKAAAARYLAAVEGQHWLRTQIVADVAYWYYELLALDNELEIITQNLALLNRALGIILVQKQAGFSNELAVQQFEAQVLEARGFEFELKQQILEAENRLNFLLGRSAQPIVRRKAAFEVPALSVPVGQPADLLQNRPDIRQAEQLFAATGADTRAARAAFYPSLNLGAAMGLQSFNASFWLSPASAAYNLLGGLAAPLLNRSQLKARLGMARAAEVEAAYHYQQTVQQAYFEVLTQLGRLGSLEQMARLKEQEVVTLTRAIDTSFALFAAGRASYLEVIITQTNALQANIDRALIRKRQYQATVDLYRALGGGWR